MGADGGSIPKRVELVKTKARTTTQQKNNDSWKYCAFSKEPLRAPVVTCKRGRLYNKEAVLQFLLNRRAEDEEVSHIKSLKDVTTLKVTVNPAYGKNGVLKVDQQKDSGASPFVCPVTGREMNGNFRFFYLKRCGCVLSEQALKEIASETCLGCGKPREMDDLVEINPATKDIISAVARKRPAEALSEKEAAPYLPTEDGYRSSLSSSTTFHKTAAIDSLYKK
jgi:hypothetical protein